VRTNPKQTPLDFKGQKGFTLIELLIASVLFIAAIGVVLGFLGRAKNASEITDYVLESRQNARAALDFIVSEIRMAGTGISVPVVTSDANGDSVILYPITPGGLDGAPGSLTLLGQLDDVETTIRDQMPNASSEIKVESVEGFSEGDLVVITNGSFANLFEVTQVQIAARKLQHNPSSPFNKPGGHRPWPPGGYGPGSRTFKISLITYYVDQQDSTNFRLMRQEGTDAPRIIAEYVTAFELNYGLQDGTLAAMPTDPSLIRRVIVTIETASREASRLHTTRLVSTARPRCL